MAKNGWASTGEPVGPTRSNTQGQGVNELNWVLCGNFTVCYGKWPIYHIFSLLNSVISHGYVPLPKGI